MCLNSLGGIPSAAIIRHRESLSPGSNAEMKDMKSITVACWKLQIQVVKVCLVNSRLDAVFPRCSVVHTSSKDSGLTSQGHVAAMGAWSVGMCCMIEEFSELLLRAI